MRLIITPVLVVTLVLALVVCSSKTTTTKPEPGDAVVAGDPGVTVGDSRTGGDRAAAAAVLPTHTKQPSASGTTSSANYKARVRVGGPMPAGTATGSAGTVRGGTDASP